MRPLLHRVAVCGHWRCPAESYWVAAGNSASAPQVSPSTATCTHHCSWQEGAFDWEWVCDRKATLPLEVGCLALYLSVEAEDRVFVLETWALGFVEVLSRRLCHSCMADPGRCRLIDRTIEVSVVSREEGPASWTLCAVVAMSYLDSVRTWSSSTGLSLYGTDREEERRRKCYGRQHLFDLLAGHVGEEAPLPHSSGTREDHSLPCSIKR